MIKAIQSGDYLSVPCTSPAVPASGDPVRYGLMTGVAVTDEGDGGNTATNTTVCFGGGVYDLSVTDVATGGIAVGDILYLHDGSPPTITNVAASGYFFGFALEAIGSGLTSTINVRHVQSPGAGSTGAGTVGTTELAANGVTAAKLTATLRTGYIPLDIFSAHVIGTNAIAAQVGASSDPLLKRTNGATDKSAMIAWESASVIEIQLPSACYPDDLDDTGDVVVHLLAKMKAGSVDTPTLTVSAWEGVGDTNMGSATAALSTTMQDLTVTLATANISAEPNVLNLTVTPGAHNTASNDVHLYGAWITYTRK